MKAVVYLNASYCEDRRQGYEMEARAFAAKQGYSVARTVVEAKNDALPWLLLKAKQLQVTAIVTPSIDHIGARAQDVLDRCDLLIVYPSGFLPHGTRLAIPAHASRP
ncbi:hypothetical protein GV794_09220 [Nocardia cyriacigeorgica]|uniref:Uncharacterized protein n=1 Tax=Nocardia cyriacigeorgica TaxID=135487 RepID=A0A6P1DC85_9NOCA|nr:hypothetical protein [Nocardia cyriacigeorgica]NEW41527.1 hypothetical protein [Nocardia cyriacigeorgica]NEW46774.1 hypothetical protein [Nocardia cyriacigeorgica]NEW52039.1 hypothetical protein [Nocardia cyriacigeorgica]NEW55832.1 hypothetical protein [Nocardia cyriacigeorgica]